MSTTAIPPKPREGQHLTAPQFCEREQISLSTAAKWRLKGGSGPRFLKAGRKILYPVAAVEEWEASNTRRSTSDTGVH